MIAIGLLGLPLRLLPIGIAVGTWFALRPWWRPRGLRELVTALAILVVMTALSWSAVTAALDSARGQLVSATPPLARRAWKHAVRLLWRRVAPLMSVAALSVFGFTVVTASYLLCSHFWPTGLTLLPLKLAAAYGRAGISVAALLAASRIG